MCGHVIGIDHISRSTTRSIYYGAIHNGTIHFGAIHYGAIHDGASAMDNMMQEVNETDRQYPTADLVNRWA